MILNLRRLRFRKFWIQNSKWWIIQNSVTSQKSYNFLVQNSSFSPAPRLSSPSYPQNSTQHHQNPKIQKTANTTPSIVCNLSIFILLDQKLRIKVSKNNSELKHTLLSNKSKKILKSKYQKFLPALPQLGKNHSFHKNQDKNLTKDKNLNSYSGEESPKYYLNLLSKGNSFTSFENQEILEEKIEIKRQYPSSQ